MQLVGALQFYTDSQGVLYAADPTTGQPYVIGQAGGSIVAAGIVTEAPADGLFYARQNDAWSVISAPAPWTPCTYPPGCSGNLYVRRVGSSSFGTLEFIGDASSVATWDGTYSFVLAYMPSGMAPAIDRFVLVPSSNSATKPDSISCAWIKPTGDIVMGEIYGRGLNPLMAWFGGVSIQA